MACLCIEYSVFISFALTSQMTNIMTYNQVKKHVEKLGERFHIVELLVILLLASFVLGNFHGFSNIFWITKIDRLGQKKTYNGSGEIKLSFLRKNLVIDWDYYRYLSTSGKKKAIWPDGDIYNSPVFLSPTEKKPYYLFNLDINFGAYHLRLFRNFTKGDGTLKFAENHNEIKALVFYKKDAAKVMKIKRKIERIVWEKKSGKGKTWGILFFED